MRKVGKGERLKIPAETYNAFVDAAEAHRDRSLTLTRGHHGANSDAGVVFVKNASGADCDRFGILAVDSPIILPTDNEISFKNQVALAGTTPDAETGAGRFVILLEPLPDGKIGRGLLAGVCPVKVDVQGENDGYADIADGVTASLKSGPSGSAQILWKESGTGVRWTVVRVGNPVPFEMARFSGICMIDSENPTAKNPGVSSAYSEGSTAEGQPGKPTDQQWLLMKFAGAPLTLPWQTWNWHIPVVVSASGGDEGWFVYWAQLILNDFYVADDPEADPPQECATWATSPIDTTWGLGGNGVSSKIPTSMWQFPDGQLLSIKWANSSLDGETAYGVALRPHSWWNWGDPPPQLSASLSMDYTQCRIMA